MVYCRDSYILVAVRVGFTTVDIQGKFEWQIAASLEDINKEFTKAVV